ncbi:MAG TPA: PAS domain S-box protein [Humisphaera sp.]|jgi:PAS domain S-box-containing protein|nr:PAS domain S-box protein [Humisphaera sp.]
MGEFAKPELSSVHEAQALLAAIIDSSDDAIISKDLSGIVRSWNQSAQRIFGYTAEEMLGKPITILFPPDRLGEESEILKRLQRGERVDHIETVRIRKDARPPPGTK